MQHLKNIFWTLLLASGCLFFACQKNEICNCPPIDGQFFDIEGIYLTNFIQENSYPTDCCMDTIPWDTYYLMMNFETSYFDVGLQQNEQPNGFDFSLLPIANACSCNFNGEAGSIEIIDSIGVKTLNDFDATHPANSNINEYIDIFAYLGQFDLNEYLAADSSFIRFPQIGFLLKQRPEIDSHFQVEITFRLTNNETYIATNGVVFLE